MTAGHGHSAGSAPRQSGAEGAAAEPPGQKFPHVEAATPVAPAAAAPRAPPSLPGGKFVRHPLRAPLSSPRRVRTGRLSSGGCPAASRAGCPCRPGRRWGLRREQGRRGDPRPAAAPSTAQPAGSAARARLPAPGRDRPPRPRPPRGTHRPSRGPRGVAEPLPKSLSPRGLAQGHPLPGRRRVSRCPHAPFGGHRSSAAVALPEEGAGRPGSAGLCSPAASPSGSARVPLRPERCRGSPSRGCSGRWRRLGQPVNPPGVSPSEHWGRLPVPVPLQLACDHSYAAEPCVCATESVTVHCESYTCPKSCSLWFCLQGKIFSAFCVFESSRFPFCLFF